MNLYAYKLSVHPEYHNPAAWNERAQQILSEHAEYLQAGLKSGRVMMVGRTDTSLEKNFGMAVFEAAGENEAAQFMRRDPAVAGGIMIAEVFPFKLLSVSPQAKKWFAW